MYLFAKGLVRLGLLFFCRKIIFNNKHVLNQKGPLLLACNHPNSFLDALIIGSYFKRPVHFLARGDAFKNPIAKKILTALKAIPIYRLKESKEYLALNDSTFDRCLKILEQGGIVLIFSEGLCVNKWELRPLKKGTARIAINAWRNPLIGEALKIIPVSLSYSSFTHFDKNVFINFSDPIIEQQLIKTKIEASQIVEFNKLLYQRLQKGMLIENNEKLVPFILNNVELKEQENGIAFIKNFQASCHFTDIAKVAKRLYGTGKVSSNTNVVTDMVASIVLFLPALIGYLLHLPLYLPVNNFIRQKTNDAVFYHSALFGLLLIVYPFYVVIISIITMLALSVTAGIIMLLLPPLLSVLFIQWRGCIERVYNYYRLTNRERSLLQSALKTSAT